MNAEEGASCCRRLSSVRGILFVIGIPLTFIGLTMTCVSHRKPSPPFDTPFFIKANEDDPIRVVGPILLSLGLTSLVAALICLFVGKWKEEHLHPQARDQRHVSTIPDIPYVLPQQLYSQYPPIFSQPYQHPPPTTSHFSPPNDLDQPPSYGALYGTSNHCDAPKV